MGKHNRTNESGSSEVIENLAQLNAEQAENFTLPLPPTLTVEDLVTTDHVLTPDGEIVEAPAPLQTEVEGNLAVAAPAPQPTLPQEHRVDEEAFSKASNTSERMRELSRQGFKVSAIAKIMEARFGAGRKFPFRYQHVRNVLNQPLKRKAS
jgi:hypothetical protein